MKLFNFYKPKLSDVSYANGSWELHEDTKNSKSWYTEQRDATRIQLIKNPTGWPFDLRSESKAKDFFEKQSRDIGGALVEIEIKRIAQVETLVAITKHKAPVKDSLAMYYSGIILMPFDKFTFQINFESMEQGETGMREAAVALVESPKPQKPTEEPEVVSMKELFEKLRSNQIKVLPSDDRKHDQAFPNHPLTKVRNYLEYFENNVVISKRLLKQQPYRSENG